MPKKVGRIHDHLLPVVANLEPGEVWACDCNKLFQVTAAGPDGRERLWNTIENDPAAVDFIKEEKVEEPAEEESAEAGESKDEPAGE